MLFPLPAPLQQAIQSELARFTPAQLREISAALSIAYRQGAATPKLSTEIYRAAYLLTRLPATYAAVKAVLYELKLRWPEFTPLRLLDLGAGPGTAWWAAGTTFANLKTTVLFERDAGFVALGKRLVLGSGYPSEWRVADLKKSTELPPADLVTLAYALNELDITTQTALLKRVRQTDAQAFAIIEPGTKTGFANILRAREELLQLGAYILAPCPHADACPMAAQDDWCHFAQRLERSTQHRHAKNAALGYEDEKYSYLIVSRQPVTPAPSRIVRHPLKLKGHVKLTVCAPEGVRQEVVTAKTKEVYKNARKAEWGDAWSEAEARA